MTSAPSVVGSSLESPTELSRPTPKISEEGIKNANEIHPQVQQKMQKFFCYEIVHILLQALQMVSSLFCRLEVTIGDHGKEWIPPSTTSLQQALKPSEQ
jgi:hypothetical protein